MGPLGEALLRERRHILEQGLAAAFVHRAGARRGEQGKAAAPLREMPVEVALAPSAKRPRLER